ncbi:MAG: sulfotransferase, partial [Pseudonocardiaceae bacterium]
MGRRARLRDADWGHADTLDAAILHWRRLVLYGRRAGRSLGPTRYLEVRYEALIDDPEGTIRRVC